MALPPLERVCVLVILLTVGSSSFAMDACNPDRINVLAKQVGLQEVLSVSRVECKETPPIIEFEYKMLNDPQLQDQTESAYSDRNGTS